eukprot:SAG11_NODE_1535_length_4727_cov_4.389369_3_plen_157_part_00
MYCIAVWRFLNQRTFPIILESPRVSVHTVRCVCLSRTSSPRSARPACASFARLHLASNARVHVLARGPRQPRSSLEMVAWPGCPVRIARVSAPPPWAVALVPHSSMGLVLLIAPSLRLVPLVVPCRTPRLLLLVPPLSTACRFLFCAAPTSEISPH